MRLQPRKIRVALVYACCFVSVVFSWLPCITSTRSAPKFFRATCISGPGYWLLLKTVLKDHCQLISKSQNDPFIHMFSSFIGLRSIEPEGWKFNANSLPARKHHKLVLAFRFCQLHGTATPLIYLWMKNDTYPVLFKSVLRFRVIITWSKISIFKRELAIWLNGSPSSLAIPQASDASKWWVSLGS